MLTLPCIGVGRRGVGRGAASPGPAGAVGLAPPSPSHRLGPAEITERVLLRPGLAAAAAFLHSAGLLVVAWRSAGVNGVSGPGADSPVTGGPVIPGLQSPVSSGIFKQKGFRHQSMLSGARLARQIQHIIFLVFALFAINCLYHTDF